MKKKPNQQGTAKGRLEKDADDLVHSTPPDLPTEPGKHDPDDLVHNPTPKMPFGNVDESLADPDDLVHGPSDPDDDER